MKKSNQPIQDLIIIGDGIMGLMTAYYATTFVKNITILEKRTISKENKEAASFSYARSVRSDYPNPFYTKLAYEAQELWRQMKKKSSKKFYIACGCINLAKKSITPDISKTYATESYVTRMELSFATKMLNKTELTKRFPQFDVDFGSLEETGGFLLQQVIKDLLLSLLKQKKVAIKENIEVLSLEEENNAVFVKTKKESFVAKKIVITAG